MIRLSTTGMVQ